MNYGIGNIKNIDKSKSLFTTTTAPTESGGVITLATTYIVESGFKVGDYLAYVDSDNISALYSISAISSGTATLNKIGNIGGGGKQLYLNNIYINNLKWTRGDTRYFVGVISLILDVQFTTASDFISWYRDVSSDVVVDGIGTGYESGYITHIRKLRIPTIVSDKVYAKFDMIHTNNGSMAFTNNQTSSTALVDQDIRTESRAL